MQSARVACVTALLAALTCTLQPASALATCTVGPLGFAVWPKADATDVPIDTPIVIGRYYVDGDTSVIETSLSAADGTDVPLHELNRLPPPWRGCGSSEYLFLRPMQKLSAGETYTLTTTSGAKGPVTHSAFTVGQDSAVAEPNVHPDITYLKVLTRPECVHEECEAYANLLVELEASPSRPLWLRLQGSHPQQNAHAWTFYPMGWSAQQEALPEIQLSVPLAAGDDCVDIQIYGVEGRALFDERRCKPDRCAVYGIVAGRNSGGGPGGSPVDVKAVPPESCDDPPVLLDGQGRIAGPGAADSQMKQSVVDAGAESYADDASVPGGREGGAASALPDNQAARKGPAANGCSIWRAEGGSTPVAVLFAVFTLVMLRAARRFARTSDSASS